MISGAPEIRVGRNTVESLTQIHVANRFRYSLRVSFMWEIWFCNFYFECLRGHFIAGLCIYTIPACTWKLSNHLVWTSCWTTLCRQWSHIPWMYHISTTCWSNHRGLFCLTQFLLLMWAYYAQFSYLKWLYIKTQY